MAFKDMRSEYFWLLYDFLYGRMICQHYLLACITSCMCYLCSKVTLSLFSLLFCLVFLFFFFFFFFTQIVFVFKIIFLNTSLERPMIKSWVCSATNHWAKRHCWRRVSAFDIINSVKRAIYTCIIDANVSDVR